MNRLPIKISVVTPSFNQASFLEQTIRSVLDQGYANLEYVIIDGGSSDGSAEIINTVSHRLHYWISERDEGHAHALNKGFAQTSGEVMCWLNSDDMYLPWTFRVVSEIFSGFPNINWIIGLNSWWSEHGVITGAARVPKNIYDYLLGDYAWIQQESVFWRRSLWELTGGYIDQSYRLMVDGELWSRFFLKDQLYLVDCILGGYRQHSSNRAMHNYKECETEMIKAINAMRLRCPSDIISTYRALRCIKVLKHAPIMRHFPIEKIARRIMPSAYQRAGYPILSYHDGAWKHSGSQFTV